uniref:Uncharacterized protein n=1 Tax=Florenciella sp. virus SA2 TaxID=3240092 RepID=A0AB39JCD7_9VIRU
MNDTTKEVHNEFKLMFKIHNNYETKYLKYKNSHMYQMQPKKYNKNRNNTPQRILNVRKLRW